MPRRVVTPSLVLLFLTLVASACSEGGTEPRVVSVEISPDAATLQDLGSTQQFSARVEDQNGTVLTGEEVTWASDEPGVATVSTSGLATAVGSGVASITASSGGVTGTALLTVLEANVECVDPETVTLAVGDEAAFGSQECFVLPAGEPGDRYRVVVTRPDSGTANSVSDVTLTVTEVGETSAAASPPPLLSGAGRRSLRLDPDTRAALEHSLRVADATERFHARLRASEATLVERLGPDAVLVPPTGAARTSSALQEAPGKVRIDPSTQCSEPDGEATGLLVHASDELAIYQDSAQRSDDPVTTSQASRMARYYADHGKEVVERYFGTPTDIDGNGRVIVFISPVVADDQVAGFVWSGDFFDKAQCEASNEGEVIFFNADLIQRLDNAQSPNYQALETLVHEMKHVVSLYNRVRASVAAGAGRFQPLWIEEGTAEIAGNMSSREALEAVGAVAVGERLTAEAFETAEGGLESTPENYGILLRMLRTVRYLSSQPNGVLVSPNGAHPDHSIYGTGWHFHRWLGDAYGNAATPRADSALFRALADSTTAPGSAGLLAVTGRTFKELFEEYVLAVTLHETGAPEGLRGFTTYDFVSATDILCRKDPDDPTDEGCPVGVDPQPDGLYPWPVTERSGRPSESVPGAFGTAEFRGPIGPTGMRIHDFLSDGTASLRVEVRMGVPGKILVVRLR